MLHRIVGSLALASLVTACGSDHDHGATDAAADHTHAVTDASGDGAAVAPSLNDCNAADYEDRSAGVDTARVVRAVGTTSYTPRCLTIRAGQSVTFEMSFVTHPLAPGVAHGPSTGATTPNPIQAQSAGMTYTATFASAGYYPFYCTVHGHSGMAGVVRVQ